jgi:hypothetical protein
MRFYGSAGTVDSHYGGFVRITGEKPWNGVDKDDTFRQGAVTNVKNFVAAIKAGKALHNVEESVDSNLTCILGRTAAYEQRLVTWDEMMRRNQKVEVNLRL